MIAASDSDDDEVEDDDDDPCLPGCVLLPDRGPEGERANGSLPHSHHDDQVRQ